MQNIRLFFVSVFVFGLSAPVSSFGQQSVPENAVAVLLSRLDLSQPGLEQVRDAANPEAATKKFLNYYRERTFVKHPIDRAVKQTSQGKYASARDIETADNALKHIFVGQPAYPPFFCGEDINWNSRPVPDNEWVWQLNRMTFWTAMSRAYWHTGDEKYAEAWVYQLSDWVKKNPRDNDHAHAWRSIEAGIRGHQWTYHFQHFIDSPAFTPEFLVTFLNSCYDHATYLMTRYSAKSNWGLMEAEGMAFIAIMFPEFKDSEKWITEAIRRLNIEIDNQVYSDGHHRELAIGYHLGCISWFSRTLDLAHMNGREDAFPVSYRATIEKMCEVPMKLGMPDGSNTQFGNSWKGSPGANWGNLRRWAVRYNRPDFLYVATDGREGEMPQESAFACKESGLYSMRSGWYRDAICLVLKCGPYGGWHTHPDNGTFELYAGGRHLMPDSGVYVYSGDPENTSWFRQSRVHQTLTLDGKDIAFAPNLLFWRTGEDWDALVVENVSYVDLTHRRAVFFVDKSFFVIVDEAYGGGTGETAIHFQIAPGEAVFDQDALTVRTDFQDGWNVLVQSVLPDGATLEEEKGRVSFVYTREEPRPAFRYRIPKTDAEGIRYVTLVIPYADSPPNVKVKLLGNPVIGGNELEMTVTVNGAVRQIGYSF